MLAFTTGHGVDESDIPIKKHRSSRISSQDPMSHRIIEKRRRDRMNNCLAELSHLIPSTYLKQGQGRIEKTEIIEMATRHIKQLQAITMETNKVTCENGQCCLSQYMNGFNECMDEVSRFLVTKNNFSAVSPLCVDLMGHLKDARQNLCQRVSRMQDAADIFDLDGDTKDSPSRGTSAGNTFNGSLKDQEPHEKTTSRSSPQDLVMSDGGQSLASKEHSAMKPSPDSIAEELLNGVVGIRENGFNVQQSTNQIFSPIMEGSEPRALSQRSTLGECLLTCVLPEPRRESGHSSELDQAGRPQDLSSNSSVSSRDSDSSKSASLASYKFKSHIKRRFNAMLGDKDSASFSSDLDVGDSKQRLAQLCASESGRSDSTSNFSSPSECSSNNSSPQVCPTAPSQRHLKQNPEQVTSSHYEDANGSVPGFVLHPRGTYYVPIVIAIQHVMQYFQSEPASSTMGGICHPVSIPVIFTGPIIPQSSSPRNRTSSFNASIRSTSFASSSDFAFSASHIQNHSKPMHI